MPHFLAVFLGERFVGTITNLTSDHNVFTFDSGYVQDPERPVLSLAFYDRAGVLSTPTKTPQVRLLPFFANLLPEGHLRQYLANLGRINSNRDFPLLRLLGGDLPGAVVVRQHAGPGDSPGVSRRIARKGVEADPAVLKFSLAGVQLKFSAIAEAAAGLTIPAHGQNGDWLLKMPSTVYAGVPENEFAMLTFARAAGIEVPEMALIDPATVRNLPPEVRTDFGRALAIRRFDRPAGRRVHIEDFNQIYNQYPADKYRNVSYGNMLADIWRVMGQDEAREFVRRVAFNIGIGNADMHLKNWSVIYSDGKTPRLAPAYDYVATVAYIDDDGLALTLAGTRRWADIDYGRLERFARRAGVPRGIVLEATREMVTRMRDVWPKLRGELDLPQRTVARIDAQLNSVPIFAGRASSGGGFPTSGGHKEIE